MKSLAMLATTDVDAAVRHIPTPVLRREIARRSEFNHLEEKLTEVEVFIAFSEDYFTVPRGSMVSAGRGLKVVADARSVAMSLAYLEFKLGNTQTAKAFGRENHSTVSAARKRVTQRENLREMLVGLAKAWKNRNPSP